MMPLHIIMRVWLQKQSICIRASTICVAGKKRSGVGTCPRHGASGITRFLCYLMLFITSLVNFHSPLLYISGREVSKVRMRGVTTWEVDWSSPRHAFENVCVFDEHSYRHLRPVTKLICSTFQLWRRITSLRALPMDAYWFSDVSLAPRRYCSVHPTYACNLECRILQPYFQQVGGPLYHLAAFHIASCVIFR
jgi:hypothetical protein